MPGGIYVALSGLRHQVARLDQLASDISNAGTSGYKSARLASVVSERPTFDSSMQSAIDVTRTASRTDFRPGTLEPTSRALDFAIEGRGFFVVDTPAGERFTRDGHFRRGADGTLQTTDGSAVQMEAGGPLVVGGGEIAMDENGNVIVGGAVAGRFRIVDFEDTGLLSREAGGRFFAPEEAALFPMTDPAVKNGVLEGSNVSLAERLVQVTEASRSFEALQRGISILMNDVDGRAITELGRPR